MRKYTKNKLKNGVKWRINLNEFLTFVQNTYKRRLIMSFLRVLLCILFPPLAVVDYGCGSVLITLVLTLCGWVPGAIAALIICNKK